MTQKTAGVKEEEGKVWNPPKKDLHWNNSVAWPENHQQRPVKPPGTITPLSPAVSPATVILPAANSMCEFLNQRLKNKLKSLTLVDRLSSRPGLGSTYASWSSYKATLDIGWLQCFVLITKNLLFQLTCFPCNKRALAQPHLELEWFSWVKSRFHWHDVGLCKTVLPWRSYVNGWSRYYPQQKSLPEPSHADQSPSRQSYTHVFTCQIYVTHFHLGVRTLVAKKDLVKGGCLILQ